MSELIDVLSCPFCGRQPEVVPSNPDEDGDAWGMVLCSNGDCVAQPSVLDGEEISDSRGSDEYKNSAIRRWNARSNINSSTYV